VTDLQSKVRKAINGELNRPRHTEGADGGLSVSSGSDDSSSDSDEGDGISKLTEFLLDYYRGLTPHVFKSHSYEILKKSDRRLNGVPADRFFSRLSFALENVDEFVIFKKFLVTSLNSDRDRIKQFISEDGDLTKLTDFVFRCRRIRFSADRSQE